MPTLAEKLAASGLSLPAEPTPQDYKNAVMPLNLPMVPISGTPRTTSPIPNPATWAKQEVTNAGNGIPLLTELPAYNLPTQIVGAPASAPSVAPLSRAQIAQLSPEDRARYLTVAEHISEMPYTAGLATGAVPVPSAPRPSYGGGPSQPTDKTWEGPLSGTTLGQVEEEKAAAQQAAEQKAAAFDAKYFHPERFQMRPQTYQKQMELMDKQASIESKKADIEAKRLETEAMQVDAQAQYQQARAMEAEQRDKEHFARADALKADVEKKINDVATAEYNPKRIYANMSNFDKASVILGAMLGGWQQAATKSGENQFLKTLDKIVQQDLDDQEHGIASKKYAANEAKNSYAQLMADYKDRDLVRNIRETQMLKSMQTQIMSNALKSGSETAKANAEAAVNAMELRKNGLEADRDRQMYFNPDTLRGGGGGATLKKLEGEAKWAAEQDVKEDISGTLSVIDSALEAYKPGGSAWNQSPTGRMAFEKSPYFYSKLPGVQQADIAQKQKEEKAFSIIAKKEKGALTAHEEELERNNIMGDRSPQAIYTGLMNERNAILAKRKALKSGISPEGRAYIEGQQIQNPGLPKGMPGSTKPAGQ